MIDAVARSRVSGVRRRRPWSYAIIVVAIALRVVSPSTAALSYLVIAAYALWGRTNAIQALALSWLFTILSPGLMLSGGGAETSFAAIGRYAVLLGATTAIFLHKGVALQQASKGFVVFTVLLGAAIIAHSLFYSPMPDISILKALSWTLAMMTSIAAWVGLSESQRQDLSRDLFWGLVIVLAASLPLAAMPLGYLVNGTGFQGILNQPQAFGPTMGLLGAWAMSRLLGEVRPPWWLLGVVGATSGCILLSEARTAGLAMIIGVTLSVLLGSSFSGRSIGRMLPGLRSARVHAALGGVFVAGVVLAPKIAEVLRHYITKSGRADINGLGEAYQLSRGGVIDAMMINVAQHPFTGIGFGIASVPELMVVSRDPVFGLPVGASIEKGVLPLMVLEELGALGVVCVGFWELTLLQGASRGGLAPLAVCLTALLLNMGEATLFSPGGFGLLQLVLLGWAYASGQSMPRRARG